MTKTSESRRCVIMIGIKEVCSFSLIGFPLLVLIRYNAVLEACGLLQDLAELPYGEMTEVSVSIFITFSSFTFEAGLWLKGRRTLIRYPESILCRPLWSKAF